MKIIAYATTNNGDGYVTKIGEYEDWGDIKVRCGTFASDVVITFEFEMEKEHGN